MPGCVGALGMNFTPIHFLNFPGSTRYRTLPDGLWFNFGGTPEDPYVDIFAIEACASFQNLLDRSAHVARPQHPPLPVLAVCPLPWLLSPVAKEIDPTPRWKVTGLVRSRARQTT